MARGKAAEAIERSPAKLDTAAFLDGWERWFSLPRDRRLTWPRPPPRPNSKNWRALAQPPPSPKSTTRNYERLGNADAIRAKTAEAGAARPKARRARPSVSDRTPPSCR